MDWKHLINALGAAGLTQTRIAKECGCSQATVSDLANGATKEPRYALGVSLAALHARSVIPQGVPPTAPDAVRLPSRKESHAVA